jgi:hypothetical protein
MGDTKKLSHALREMSELETREFVDFVCTTIGGMKDRFEDPDDDWVPTLFVVYEQGDTSISSFYVPPWPLARELLFTVVLPQMVRAEGEVARVAFTHSGWTLDPEDVQEFMEDDSMSRIADHPNHREILSVHYGDRNGLRGISHAYILRDNEQPPGLSEWETFETPETTAEGRLFRFFEEVFR